MKLCNIKNKLDDASEQNKERRGAISLSEGGIHFLSGKAWLTEVKVKGQ